MMLRYYRYGGGTVPDEAETVEVSLDGAISGWRSVSRRGVGWFAGVLPEAEVADLATAVAGVETLSAPSGLRPPGAGTETLELAGRDPVQLAGVGEGDPEAWHRIRETGRRLVDRLTDFPRAAVGLRLPDEKHAELFHFGADALLLDLAVVEVEVAAWRAYYEPAGQWSGRVTGPERVDVASGWSFPLPIEWPIESLVAPNDVTLHVSATFRIIAESREAQVRVSHAPDLY